MLRTTLRGACLLLALVLACSAASNPDEHDGEDPLIRERRTYRHSRTRNCGKPGSPEHGWSIFGRTTAGYKVLHSCKPGYLLVGAKLRICQSNGRWTPSLPKCQLIDCGDPGEPANGRKWLGSTTLGSYVKYKCMDGFQLSGFRYRRCLSSGSWSGRLPTCVAVGCPRLRDPRNGRVSVVQGPNGVATATYTCNSGFILKGSATRRCIRGDWEGEEPVCNIVECPRLRGIAKGSVFVRGRTVGSNAYYKCNTGYSLLGNRVRTCQSNGAWSGEDPSCQRVVICPPLPSPANGRVSVGPRTPGSVANYSCNTGYQLEGSVRRTCLNDGTWSEREPICIVIECPRLSAPVNGEVSLSGRRPGSRAVYSCFPGFILGGDQRRLCQNNGQWSREPPICVAIRCPPLSNPANGEVAVEGRTAGSQASYICFPGFTLRGVETRTCQSDGQWSEEPPVCIVVITCPPLSNPANGVVNVEGNTPSSTATYVCNSGYELSGTETRICQSDGIWSDQPPLCIESFCPALTDPPNGQVSVLSQTVNSIATYSCDAGFTLEGSATRTCVDRGEGVIIWTGQEPRCVPMRCPRLSSPANGRVFAPVRTVGSQALYSCNDGYRLRGVDTRFCQSNVEWSGEAPVCEVVDCGDLPDILNGRVSLSSTTFGSFATYRCNRGFAIVGTSVRRCLASGVWSGREPACEPSTCGPLDNPANGQVSITGASIGATASYSCNSGYVLRGVVSRVCQSNGVWSGVPPTCEAMTCSNLPAPANGDIDISGFTYTSTATYSCDDGYILVGVDTRTCQEDGSWSGIPPFCQIVQCEMLEFPLNGQVIQFGNTLGATGTYSCFPGYLLVGEEVRVCQKSGEWSDVPPTCQPVDCGSPPEIEFGVVGFASTTFGSRAAYTCQVGYVLIGASIRNCLADGTWSGDPSCQIFTCSSLDDPVNGQVFTTGFDVGDSATYTCRDGFTLQGNDMRICQSNGQWSGSAPVCTGVRCPVLTDPDNGVVIMQGVTVGSTATYSCLPGFVLQGSEDTTCLSTGIWSGSVPVCIAVDCPDLPDPDNGEVTILGFILDSTATYRCDVGYGLVGVSVRVCQADSTWSEQAPVCEISTCNDLEPPQNGNIMTTSTQIGGQATYSCIEGYELVGEQIRTCQASGFWSGSAPFCRLVRCSLLAPPKDGRVGFSSVSYRSVAVYECLSGFRLEGVVERTCLATGVWSDKEPTCRRIDCGILEVPKNGDISFSRGTGFRSVATYSCDAPYQLEGSRTRVCLSNMEWSGEPPFCEILLCEELFSPNNGLVIVPERLPGSTATYSCNRGYNLIGSRTRNCQTNGFWTGVVPICQLADCGPLKPPVNGDVDFDGTSIGSVATYECFEGYFLEGDEIRFCVDGGVWSGVDPVCKPIDCERLQNITNGYVELDGLSLGSVASYACFDGYVLMGKGIRQCLGNSQWSGSEPVCQEVDCGNLPVPANGNVAVSGTGFGFMATYSCNQGFTPVGDLIRICQLTGEWSGQEPICIANECPVLVPPAAGSITLTGREYLDTATYSCEPDYVLSGGAIRTCGSNGIWSGVAPTCIIPPPSTVDCGPPPLLQNGQFSLSSGTIEGSVATYSCSREYRLVGRTTRTCLGAGFWSNQIITCEIIDCGDLPPIANGVITFSSTVIDSVATYECTSEYELVGVEIRICQQSGQWSSTAPTCVARQVFRCEELVAPANGAVSFTGVTVGSRASYSCNHGYVLAGEAFRRCLELQGWSGSAPICQPVDCSLLEPPLNGQVMVMGTTLGSRAHYSCDLGYVLLGSVVRTCGPDGLWSNLEPLCSAVECGDLPDPVYGFVVQSNVILGSMATYSCQTGFTLRGSVTRECGVNGDWTGVAPTCESSTPTSCGDPGTPVFGTRIGEDFRIGATVYFECNTGYELDGPGSRQCLPSGVWSNRLPQCVDITETCEEGATVYEDVCGRRCTCSGGVLVNCCRVRRDFASLSVADRQHYIGTVITVATVDKYRAKYEALITHYRESADTVAQSLNPEDSQFFPWNRYFLLQYEDLLQEVDCRVTIPYWDWTALPLSPYQAPVWNPESGFGDSARGIDGCVENGPFSFDQFEVVGGGCLQRDYRMQMFPTRATIEQELLPLPAEEYMQFHRFLQIFVHLNVRCFVGGQMCSDDAANDPAYILHLAQIDSIYTRWQKVNISNLLILTSNNGELALSNGTLLVSDFGDNSDLPGDNAVCYDRADFNAHVPASMQFLAHTLESMTTNSNMRMSCVTDGNLGKVPMSEDAADFMHKMCDN